MSIEVLKRIIIKYFPVDKFFEQIKRNKSSN